MAADFGTGKCWRCGANPVALGADPMLPRTDRIGVCQPCRDERIKIMRRYLRVGRSIAPTADPVLDRP